MPSSFLENDHALNTASKSDQNLTTQGGVMILKMGGVMIVVKTPFWWGHDSEKSHLNRIWIEIVL